MQFRGDHEWLPLTCGILSSSSDIERCWAVVNIIISIRLFDSAVLMYVYPGVCDVLENQLFGYATCIKVVC